MSKEHIAIVGGTSGLGAFYAASLQQRGIPCSVIARKLRNNSTENFFQCDIVDEVSLENTFNLINKRSGPLTGLLFTQRYRSDGINNWDEEIATTLTSTRNVLKRLPNFVSVDGCSVVIITSITNFMISNAPDTYHVAKAGLSQLMKYYACNLGEYNIRLNCIAPISFVKDFNHSKWRESEVQSFLNNNIPLKKFPTVRDISFLIDFLLSSKASLLTGQEFVIDGGLTLNNRAMP